MLPNFINIQAKLSNKQKEEYFWVFFNLVQEKVNHIDFSMDRLPNDLAQNSMTCSHNSVILDVNNLLFTTLDRMCKNYNFVM